jgi:hypothetical protein
LTLLFKLSAHFRSASDGNDEEGVIASGSRHTGVISGKAKAAALDILSGMELVSEAKLTLLCSDAMFHSMPSKKNKQGAS